MTSDRPDFRYSFAGLRSTRPRTERIRKVVIHCTGGIRSPGGVYETLRNRKGPRTPDGLSVHYVEAVDGEMVQMAPHSLVCLHAGEANPDSVGIEVINPLLPGRVADMERKRGVHRATYRDRVRGRREVTLLDLTSAQTDALLLHVEWLCDVLRIPRRVPTEADGSLMRREMTRAELDAFEGVCGHFQVPTSPTVKLDPGTRPLELLRQRWLTKAA
jgi:N-acetyl-anhydromuramyl-L-alanine amidase AmpD